MNTTNTLNALNTLNTLNTIDREVYNFLGDNFPIYTFKINEYTFHTAEVPTKMYQTNVAKDWTGYELYPEMKEKTGYNYNEIILNKMISMGIFKITGVKKIFDLEMPSVSLLDKEPIKFLNEMETTFLKEKRQNKFIGLFWKTEGNILCEMDWLPLPNRKLDFSLNIHHFEDNAYLVIYKHNTLTQEVTFYQSLLIGESEIFYSELESFTPQRILELLEILPDGIFQHVVTAWDLFFISRYQYFMGSHPYQDSLDPVEVTIQDRVRMLLIWLNGLQEFLAKVKDLHIAGQTVVFTIKHNELNRTHVSYNTTFTPEIRKEILSKKDQFQLYAIANDYFIDIKKDN